MKSYRALLLVGVALAFCSGVYAATILVPSQQPTTPNSSATIQQMNQMPLTFTKNMGQWNERVLFRANAGGATMWFTPNGAYYQFTRRVPKADGAGTESNAMADPMQMPGREQERDSVETMMIKASFVGCNPEPQLLHRPFHCSIDRRSLCVSITLRS